jgi:merozoite surface protein 4
MTQRYRKLVTTIGLAGAFAAAAVPTAMAKHGADDPVGHNVGDDNGGLVQQAPGADDPANHDAGDDRQPAARKPEVRHRHRHHGRHHAKDARHGKDDPAGHDRGDDRGGDR